VIDEALNEEVCITPCELSMVALVKFIVLTRGEQTMLRETCSVLT